MSTHRGSLSESASASTLVARTGGTAIWSSYPTKRRGTRREWPVSGG
jgi:hypothetical protein